MLIFFGFALVLSFAAAGGGFFVQSEVLTPLFSLFPHLRESGVVDVLMRATPWLVSFFAALITAALAHLLIRGRVYMFDFWVLLAVVIAWPAGSVINTVGTIGWGEVFRFSYNFWESVWLSDSLAPFEFINWQEALIFLISGILVFSVITKVYGGTQQVGTN